MAHDNSRLITTAQIEAFRAQLRGEVLDPSSPAYDATRVVWNGMIDRRPAIIARCRNAADVAASINFARKLRGVAHEIFANICRVVF